MSGAMTIGKLAGAAGVGVETIRYYQRRGLIAEPARAGGIRRYDAADLSRLRFVRSAQAAGFTLDEIGELLSLDASQDRARAHALATARLAALDAKLVELEAAKRWLGTLARECGGAGAGPCPILAAFEGTGLDARPRD